MIVRTIALAAFLALAALMPEQAQARVYWPSNKQLASCPVNFMIVMKPSKKRTWCNKWSRRLP